MPIVDAKKLEKLITEEYNAVNGFCSESEVCIGKGGNKKFILRTVVCDRADIRLNPAHRCIDFAYEKAQRAERVAKRKAKKAVQ